eukprot:m51a1_g14182 hypothetical protein (330) ;mRNA; r:61036-62368
MMMTALHHLQQQQQPLQSQQQSQARGSSGILLPHASASSSTGIAAVPGISPLGPLGTARGPQQTASALSTSRLASRGPLASVGEGGPLMPLSLPGTSKGHRPAVQAAAQSGGAAGGFLILRDVPKVCIVVDGVPVDIGNAFRGFYGVPSGEHAFQITERGGALVPFKASVAQGGVLVLKYEGGKVVEDKENQELFRSLATAGSLSQALIPWPQMSPVVNDRQTGFSFADMKKLKDAFDKVATTGSRSAFQGYADVLHANYCADDSMRQHVSYFSTYGKLVLEHVKKVPEIVKKEECRVYLEFLWKDLQLLGHPEAAETGEELEDFLITH